jgi:hypothetical protein
MSIRMLCLSGAMAVLVAGSALSADYGDQRPSSTVERVRPRHHGGRLPSELKIIWRQEERTQLRSLPREQRHGWLRAQWSRMSEPQKQAKIAELQAKWNALPANVRQALLEKKREKREARRMKRGGNYHKQGQGEQPSEPMQQ